MAIDDFRADRLGESVDDYLVAFDNYSTKVEELLETTVDFSLVSDNAIAILTDPHLLEAFRYLGAPPISTADLETLADAKLSQSRLKSDPEMVQRLVAVVCAALDRRRFPWVTEKRDPTEAERNAAVLASASLLASSHLETSRRTKLKIAQENLVEEALISAGMVKVPTRSIATTLQDAPGPGQFCRESTLGTRKADMVIRLWDGRILALECKVSNSSTNSVKRLNNDAAVKAEVWKKDFGQKQIVPAALLSGVYKILNLEEAQSRGLTIFWAHSIGALLEFVESSRPPIRESRR